MQCIKCIKQKVCKKKCVVASITQMVIKKLKQNQRKSTKIKEIQTKSKKINKNQRKLTKIKET